MKPGEHKTVQARILAYAGQKGVSRNTSPLHYVRFLAERPADSDPKRSFTIVVQFAQKLPLTVITHPARRFWSILSGPDSDIY